MEKNFKKDVSKLLTGGIAATAVIKLSTAVCAFWNVALVASVLMAMYVAVNVINGKRMTKRGVVAILAIVILMMLCGAYCRFNNHKVATANNIVESSNDTTDDTEETETEEVEEVVETESTSKNSKRERGYCPESEKIEVTFDNVSEEKPAEVKVTSEEPAEIIFEDNSKEIAEAEEAIADAKENGDNVEELANGIVAIEKNEEVTEESKEDTEKTELDKENAEEVISGTEEEVVEENKENDVAVSDDELDNMLSETNDYVAPAEGNVEVEDVTIEDKIEIPAEDVQEEVVEEVTEKAISVSAVDGYETTINSTVQFMVSGDNVVVDGLDGISYSLNNGVLNVNVGSEATVLTVELTNSVSSVSFDIVVNGVVNQ